MLRRKPYFILFILIGFFTGTVYAQEKYEKESRIRAHKVPAPALEFIDSLNLQTRIRWYLEVGLEQYTFEAKFKHNRLAYSVEFDSLGTVEDVEVDIKWNDQNPLLKETVAYHLNDDCLQFKITDAQIQYSGAAADLFTILAKKERTEEVEVRYELIVRCKTQESVDLFEYVFSKTGEPLSVLKIVFKKSSHLEF